VCEFVKDLKPSELDLSCFSTGSLGYEAIVVMQQLLPLLIVTLILMFSFVLLMTGTDTRIPGQTQILACVFCTGIPGVASFAGIGLATYSGLALNSLCGIAPFLGLAVGIDELFLVVSAINSVPVSVEDPEEILAEALPRAGTAAFCTTTTDVVAFSVGALTCTILPGFFAFCMCLVFVLALGFIGMLTAAPAAMILNERWIRKGCNFVPCRKKDMVPEVSPGSVDVSVIPAPAFANPLSRLRVSYRAKGLISNRLAPLLEKSLACQLVGAGLMIIMLVGFACVTPDVGRGMPDRYFFLDDGPSQDFLDDIDTAFGSKVPLPLNVLFPKPQLHEAVYRDALKIFIEKLGNRSDAIIPPVCWLKEAAGLLPYWADELRVSQTLFVIWNEPMVRKHYEWDRLSNGAGDLDAARCHCYFWQPTDADERAMQALELMDEADNAGLDTVVYHESFPVHVARWRRVKEAVLRTSGWALLSVFCSLMFLLPARGALLAVFNVTGVLVVLLGFMSLTGATYNATTYATSVMAIGFCIDYSCHMVHFATHGFSPGAGWDVRAAHALRECGYDVLLGCATAFIGVFCLSFHRAEGFRIVAHNAMLIISVGGLFALWCLPSALALWSRAFATVHKWRTTSLETSVESQQDMEIDS